MTRPQPFRRPAAATVVVLATTLLAACSDEPSRPSPAPADAVTHYTAVHDDVTDVLVRALPGAEWSADDATPALTAQPDGTCTLLLTRDGFSGGTPMSPDVVDALAAELDTALEPYGFEPSDVDEAEHGGFVRVETEDASGWVVEVTDLSSQSVVLRISGPVAAHTCDESALPG